MRALSKNPNAVNITETQSTADVQWKQLHAQHLETPRKLFFYRLCKYLVYMVVKYNHTKIFPTKSMQPINHLIHCLGGSPGKPNSHPYSACMHYRFQLVNSTSRLHCHLADSLIKAWIKLACFGIFQGKEKHEICKQSRRLARWGATTELSPRPLGSKPS